VPCDTEASTDPTREPRNPPAEWMRRVQENVLPVIWTPTEHGGITRTVR
jgi:hypothetical protein